LSVWFAVVMGLCGLALAWYRAVPLMGDMAGAAALAIGGLAALVLVALAAATVLRRINATPKPGPKTCATRCATRLWRRCPFPCCCWPP
jgi:hypothetical protein